MARLEDEPSSKSVSKKRGTGGRPGKDLKWAKERAGRLQEWYSANFAKHDDAAKHLGIARTTFHDWLDTHNPAPDHKRLTVLAVKGRINLNWYLLGNGSMSIDDISVAAGEQTTFRGQLKSRLIDRLRVNDHEAEIQLVDATDDFMNAAVDAFELAFYSRKYEKAHERILASDRSKSRRL